MPCGYVLSHPLARERRLQGVHVYIFCVRLLRCPFYCNGHYQGLYKRDGQQVQALTLFCFNTIPFTVSRGKIL